MSSRTFAERLSWPLVLTLLISIAGVLALQLWRPLFHLTDDNLDGWLPVTFEWSRNLWSGRNPWVSHALFGGGYNFLADPGCISMISPYILLASPLALTRWYFLMPDVVASLNLITIALAFCWSATRLRETLALKASDGMVVFLSISYAFSPFNLLVNSSWVGFINPQAAMPVIVAALFETHRRRAVLMVAGAMLFALFGSHLHPFIYMSGFMGLLTVIVAWQRHSLEPLIRFCFGGAIALAVVLPLLAPATIGFTTSQRQAPLTMSDATASRLSPGQLAASTLLGPSAATFFPKMSVHYSDPAYSTAVAFSLVNLPLVWILARKRRFSAMEIGIIAGIALAALLVTRPDWLQTIMLQLPLLRSLRWPFREVANLNFFIHLLALLNLSTLFDKRTRLGLCAGGLSFATVFLGAAPTFHPMSVDRQLILSGETDNFWSKLRDRIGEEPRVIVAAHPSLTFGPQIRHSPFSLMGAYNYAALFGFQNISGYSPTQAGSALTQGFRPYHFGGIYHNPHAHKVVEQHPELTLVELLQNQPSIISVRYRESRWLFRYDEDTGRVTELQVAPAATH